MKEIEYYILNKLVGKYKIPYCEAVIFYIDIVRRKKIEDLIVKIDDYSTFDELKNYYYYGGN